MRYFILTVLVCLGGIGVAAVALTPSDTDHADATTPDVLAGFTDPPGAGPLDGIRFDTGLGPKGAEASILDFMQFDQGLFMSRECTDRCNYPPSAYLARATETGHSFIVEAFCPTKDTMVWRGEIEGDRIRGEVEWTTRRFYWSRTQVLTFEGVVSPQAADLTMTK